MKINEKSYDVFEKYVICIYLILFKMFNWIGYTK